MTVSNKETDYTKLVTSYNLGYEQAQREADAWEHFLFS